ncbi:MAG: hypothetical protein ACI8T1_001128 [Verrucomicrobiales bacterium]|jgi:hypothetical protein
MCPRILIPILFAVSLPWSSPAADSIEEVPSLGRHFGFWDNCPANYDVETAEAHQISGRIEILEPNDLDPQRLQFAFTMLKDVDGAWITEWEDPPLEIDEVEPARWLPTSLGPMLSSRFAGGPQGERGSIKSSGFWQRQDLPRNPIARMYGPWFEVSGVLPMISEIFTAGNGLASNAVRCAVQTSDGHLWFGTIGGLSRFNGSEWETYTSETAPSLPEDNITAMLEDAEGRLVIATKGEGHVLARSGGVRAVLVQSSNRWGTDWDYSTE